MAWSHSAGPGLARRRIHYERQTAAAEPLPSPAAAADSAALVSVRLVVGGEGEEGEEREKVPVQ